MQIKLTKREKSVLEFVELRSLSTGSHAMQIWLSPTEIGENVWGGKVASRFSQINGAAYASPVCLRLVEKGFLKRSPKGQYKLS